MCVCECEGMWGVSVHVHVCGMSEDVCECGVWVCGMSEDVSV